MAEGPALDEAAGRPQAGAPASGLDAKGLSQVRGGRRLLHDVSLQVEPGELVAIAGGSGAGKTTLLRAIASVSAPTEGSVSFDGLDLYEHLGELRGVLGYVPQDDIIHADLPLESTLRYAAALRLPHDMPADEKEGRVQEALSVLGLRDRARLPVKSLSGGQRKRASIGAELLTRPRAFFLDEPTSGLDPAVSSEIMDVLRRLADSGSLVVLTTHAVQDLWRCDKVLFLAPDGYVAFFGTPEGAAAYFGVETLGEVYTKLAREETPSVWARRFEESRPAGANAVGDTPGRAARAVVASRARLGSLQEWALLTRRSIDMLWRSPLTLAILLGSPLMVILMFGILFQRGAFDPADPSPSATIMIIFWVVFGAFFFGLTYGLLMICTEFPIFFRERLFGLRLLPYVASKVAVLLPVLIVICVSMLVTLRVFDRLPALSFAIYAEIAVTLSLCALAALALGLLTSAAVSNPAQATIAMPMLCFPQVLFSGAILPVPLMALAGKAMSYLMSVRWSFESLGASLGLPVLFAEGASPLGPPLLQEYGDSFALAAGESWLILAAFAAVFLAATVWVLGLKSRDG